MRKDEIKAHLSKCSSTVELIGEATKLKRSGENETMVNKVVQELRKSMLRKSKSVMKLPRTLVPVFQPPKVSTIKVMVNNLNSPTIVYDGENIVI